MRLLSVLLRMIFWILAVVNSLFFFNDPAPTEIYTLSLHDALPIFGLVSVSGGQRPAVRIRANPTALAAYGLTLEDVRTAVAATNVDRAKGGFDGPARPYTIGANDQLTSSADYRPILLAYRNGAPVRLADVATVADDAENVKQAAWMNDTPAVILNVQRQPGANVIEVVDRVTALLPQLKRTLPAGIDVSVLTD